MSEYPRVNDGETVWACCESSIGPKCGHHAEPGDENLADLSSAERSTQRGART